MLCFTDLVAFFYQLHIFWLMCAFKGDNFPVFLLDFTGIKVYEDWCTFCQCFICTIGVC